MDAVKQDAGTGLVQEVVRLTDALKMKDKQMEEQTRENATLKSQFLSIQKALTSKERDLDGAKDMASSLAGDAAATFKELEMIKSDKKKLEGQVSELMRSNAKLKDALARTGDKSPGVAQQMVELNGQIRAARADAEKAAEEAKAQANLVRAKDKELERQAVKVAEAAAVLTRNGELENIVKDLSRQLDGAHAENKTLAQVNRQREADIMSLTKDLEGARALLKATQGTLADTNATLKATTNRANEMETEIGLLRDELARTSAVASRVAASEIKNGGKDEGTVPVLVHLEECRYLNGEINRLRERVAALEKELAVSHDLKERYRIASETGGGLPPSSVRRSSSSSLTPGELDQRTRRSSASGLPQTTAGAIGSRNGASAGILSAAQQPGPAPKAAFGRAATPSSPRRRTPSTNGDTKTPTTNTPASRRPPSPSPISTARPRTALASPMRRSPSPSPMKPMSARPATASTPTKTPGSTSIMAAINGTLRSPRTVAAGAPVLPEDKATQTARPAPKMAAEPKAANHVQADQVGSEQPATQKQGGKERVEEEKEQAVAQQGSQPETSVDAPPVPPVKTPSSGTVVVEAIADAVIG